MAKRKPTVAHTPKRTAQHAGKPNPPLSEAALKEAIARQDREALAQLANAAHDDHQPDLALQALAALERLGHPQPLRIAKKRAQILLQYGRAQEAIAVLTPLLERHPDDPQVLTLLAEARYKKMRRSPPSRSCGSWWRWPPSA